MRRVLLTFWLGMFGLGGAAAAPVIYNFTGTLTHNEWPGNSFPYAVGDTLALTFTLQTAYPDTDPSARRGEYYNPTGIYDIGPVLAVDIGGTGGFAIHQYLQVFDNYTDATGQTYDGMTFEVGEPQRGWQSRFTFRTTDLDVLSSDAIPSTIDPAQFEIAVFDRLGRPLEIAAGGTIDAPTDIPEPGTLMLLLSGLIGLSVVQRYRFAPRPAEDRAMRIGVVRIAVLAVAAAPATAALLLGGLLIFAGLGREI